MYRKLIPKSSKAIKCPGHGGQASYRLQICNIFAKTIPDEL